VRGKAKGLHLLRSPLALTLTLALKWSA
jgi:hypothetical protein